MDYLSVIQFIILIVLVLSGAYLLIVKLGAKLTNREKNDLKKLLLTAIIVVILLIVFASTIARV